MEGKRRKEEACYNEVVMKEGKRREAVEEILGIVGAKEDIQEIKRIGREGDKEGEILLVKLGNEEQKKEVMEVVVLMETWMEEKGWKKWKE